jgi:hypothetical protein
VHIRKLTGPLGLATAFLAGAIVFIIGPAYAQKGSAETIGSTPAHITARVVDRAFSGDPAAPQLGDRVVVDLALSSEAGAKVGTGVAACTIVSVPPRETLEECLQTLTFPNGNVVLAGVFPLPPAVGAVARVSVAGGTGDFKKDRGEADFVVTAPDVFDIRIHLE